MTDKEHEAQLAVLKEMVSDKIFMIARFADFLQENNLMADWTKYSQEKEKGLEFWNKNTGENNVE